MSEFDQDYSGKAVSLERVMADVAGRGGAAAPARPLTVFVDDPERPYESAVDGVTVAADRIIIHTGATARYPDERADDADDAD